MEIASTMLVRSLRGFLHDLADAIASGPCLIYRSLHSLRLYITLTQLIFTVR
jgi:hypothetical protein